MNNSPLMDSGEEGRSLACVRAGLSLQGESFWDDFLSLCNNSTGLAELLGVKEATVAGWGNKVRVALEEVKRHDRQNKSEEEDKKVMPTGDTGAVTDKNMMGKQNDKFQRMAGQ